jgi:crotonobetainyl-CoA:carnitine CoA-transferase CaiB-like acyl-CoA transferase
MNDRRPPLEGVRVLAQGLAWAGPTTTAILADLGAEVIEIESIQHLNPTRTQLRHVPDVVMQSALGATYVNRDPSEGFWDRVVAFNYGKRGCLSATFDLASERGHELFLELVKQADVFLENNAANVVEKSGHRLGGAARGQPAADHGPLSRLRDHRAVRALQGLRIADGGRRRAHHGPRLPRQ